MSIIFRSLGAGLLVATLALAMHVTGGSQTTHAESALVINSSDSDSSGFACWVLDGAGNPVKTNSGVVNISTPSPRGVASFVCSAEGVSNDTGRAQRFNSGFVCYVTGVGVTEDWHATVSPSGVSTLVCHITP